MLRVFSFVAVVSAASFAHADSWLVIEAPMAIATSDAQAGAFRPGVMPAVGVYTENRFALGIRLRGGILRDGPAPQPHLEDPGMGGLTTASVAVRFGGKVWLELAGGGGLTGSDLVPAFEAGVGWTMSVGKLDIGPSARYVRVVANDKMQQFGTAELALFGVDVRFGRKRPSRVVAPVRFERTPEPVVVEVARDADRVVEREAGCVHDVELCPSTPIELAPDIVMQDDRIVLEERVLFAFDRARVRSGGRSVLAQLVKVWKEHPEWTHITVEGHADVRGTDQYNQWLSEERANRVRDVLVKLGAPADGITVTGFGRTRPRDTGTTETAYERNRRVEFVVERHVAATLGMVTP
jgi:outer membrane protein OmpA-like peptidoglycan-associated protein